MARGPSFHGISQAPLANSERDTVSMHSLDIGLVPDRKRQKQPQMAAGLRRPHLMEAPVRLTAHPERDPGGPEGPAKQLDQTVQDGLNRHSSPKHLRHLKPFHP